MTPARVLVALLATATTLSVEGKTVIGPGPSTFAFGPGAAYTYACNATVHVFTYRHAGTNTAEPLTSSTSRNACAQLQFTAPAVLIDVTSPAAM